MTKELFKEFNKVLYLTQQFRKYAARVFTAFFFGVSTFHNTVAAENVYVSDKFSIPLRAGPDVNERIIRTTIFSGAKLRRLDEQTENDFVKVQTSRGEIGWLPADFVVSEPPAKILLDEQKEVIKKLRADLKTTRKEAGVLKSRAIETEEANQEVKKRLATVEAELLNIKSLASDTIKINQDNSILKNTNQNLRAALLGLTEKEKTVSRNARYLDFLVGGSLVSAGLMLGLILKGRRRSNGWVN